MSKKCILGKTNLKENKAVDGLITSKDEIKIIIYLQSENRFLSCNLVFINLVSFAEKIVQVQKIQKQKKRIHLPLSYAG